MRFAFIVVVALMASGCACADQRKAIKELTATLESTAGREKGGVVKVTPGLRARWAAAIALGKAADDE